MARAYIGLGSNLARPIAQLRQARDALNRLPGSTLDAISGCYRNPPLGPPDQPDYVNAVARLITDLAPLELLDHLQAIERAQGRTRAGPRWGARTLDLDLLLYDDRVINEARLVVPHPGIAERAFVLWPLAEIAPPGLRIGSLGRLAELLRNVPRDSLIRVEDEQE
ncbi:MAG: 2-amino-4-hydroxy-6-hydroxymethyldihydropteridine diphosphokinase [Thiotrichales bacterium]